MLSARGGDQEQRVAFHVARQLLQPQFAGAADADLRAALGSWYDIVGPALGLCAPTQGSPPDQQGLRDGLDWVLTHLAVKRAPMVLVLDDAHWADPESLGWLAAFAPRAEQLPLLVVVAYRPDELPDHAESFRGLPGRAGVRPSTWSRSASKPSPTSCARCSVSTPTTRSATSAGPSPPGTPSRPWNSPPRSTTAA